MEILKKKDKCKYRQECGDAGDLCHCCWGCKVGKPLGKTLTVPQTLTVGLRTQLSGSMITWYLRAQVP